MRKNLLDEDAILPDVILIEEIEKAPENSLRWLLGIMDDRATIQQANARKTASRRVPALVLATANDYALLGKMMYGALLSRFSNEIYCPRPDRTILARILEREINKVPNGNPEWIEPTLRFAYDEHGMTDPRQLKRICLSGKDELISGKYQEDLLQTMRLNERVDNMPDTINVVDVEEL
jgi:MoxR-like ATPase